MTDQIREGQWCKVASVDEIPPGGFKCVNCQGSDIDIFNLDGELYAIGDVCTHAETSLCEGDFYEDIRGWVIECPLQGSQFDVTTGDAVSLPATGNAGKYEVKVEEGDIFVNP